MLKNVFLKNSLKLNLKINLFNICKFSTNRKTDPHISTEIVFKHGIEEEGSLMKSDQNVALTSNLYFDLLEEHDRMKIPFIDDDYYRRLFALTTQIVNNENMVSWEIIARYAILNYELIDLDFLTSIVENLARIKWTDFNFWYFAEKRIYKDLNSLSCRELARVVNAFGINDKGSNHLFNLFADEVLNRKMKTFNKEEFDLIYEGFKCNKIRNKLLWAILDKAKLELFS